MRKKKHGAERIAACSHLLITEPSLLHDNPQSAFQVSRPLCLEIGCGKGGFAVKTAAAEPGYNLIALERISDVMVTALESADAAADTRPDNLRFMIGNAQQPGFHGSPGRIKGGKMPEHLEKDLADDILCVFPVLQDFIN